MRWTALGVDYEMAGKDLIDSVTLSSQHLQGARRHAARGLQLRAVPRRQGREDLQVEGQRPDHRRVAELCHPREPVAVHVPEAEDGQAAVLRRDPARGRRVPAVPRRLSAPGRQGASSTMRSGTSTRESRRRPSCRSRSRCCSTWSLPRTRTTRTCCGASFAATCRARARRRIRCSTISPATRCATTRTS